MSLPAERDAHITAKLFFFIIWNDTTHLSRLSGIHTCTYMYMYTQIASDLAGLPEKGRSRNAAGTLSRKGKEEEENDMHRKSGLYQNESAVCMCVCVCVL